MSDDVFDRALDRRNAIIKEQRRRIKALEEVTQNLIALLDCDDPEVSLRAWDEALDEARAMLKEADQ